MDSVTAVLAVQKFATGSQSLTKLKHLCRSRNNNFLRVLLDTGSDGDLMFHEKEPPNVFPTWLGRCQSLGTRRMGASKPKEEANLLSKIPRVL